MSESTKLTRVDLERDVELLTSDYIRLRRAFTTYERLFCSGSERVDLLNEASGSFFSVVQQSLATSIVVGIFRLSSNTTTGRGKSQKENLVLGTLLKADPVEFGDGHDAYEARLKELEETQEVLKDQRHKLIAHRDANVARDVVQAGLASLDEIKKVIEGIGTALAIAQDSIRSTTYRFDPTERVENEYFVLDLLRIGLEISAKEDKAASQSARAGKYDYQRCYSPSPDWLTRS